jgi:DNA gyrase/topoisomerase IV subunit A
MNSEERAEAERRLPILELMEQAISRRVEVFEIVESSNDREEAQTRIVETFGVSDPRIGVAVLDMQVSRWTRQERERIANEAQRVRDLLNS